MRFIFFLILASCSPYFLFAQIGTEPSVDNFKKAMEATNPSSEMVDSILSLSNRYIFISTDTCLILAKKGMEFTERSYPEKTIHARSMLVSGDAYRVNNELVVAEKLYIKSRALYRSLGKEGKAALADNKLGALNKERGDYEEAIQYYVRALGVWDRIKDTINIYKPYINMAEVFYLLGRSQKAYDYNAKALEIAKKNKNKRVIGYATANQAILEKEIANKYVSIADTISFQSDLYRDSAQIYYLKALASQEYGLRQARTSDNKLVIIRRLGNLADLKIALGEPEEAIDLCKEAAEIARVYGFKEKIIQTEIIWSQANFDIGNYLESIAHAKIALTLAEKTGLENETSNANKRLYKAYKEIGLYDKSLEHYERQVKYQEYIQSKETNKAIAEVDVKYQTIQKEKLIIEQKNYILELQLAQDKIEKQRNNIIGGGLTLGVFALLVFKLQKTTKDRNDKKDFTEALIFAQEEERIRIARDLHDGIGQSLLLLKKQIGRTNEVTTEDQTLITGALEEIRSISKGLHPLQLEQFGLTSAITNVVQKVAHSSHLFLTIEIDNIDDLLSKNMQIHLFRTIQEVMSNIVKHAKATAAKVSVQSIEKEVVITILDNGKGFDHELAIVTSKSLGLRTMHERISVVNGQLKIRRNMPTGTIVEIKIPKKKQVI
jgi:signal transduction histidine kinase